MRLPRPFPAPAGAYTGAPRRTKREKVGGGIAVVRNLRGLPGRRKATAGRAVATRSAIMWISRRPPRCARADRLGRPRGSSARLSHEQPHLARFRLRVLAGDLPRELQHSVVVGRMAPAGRGSGAACGSLLASAAVIDFQFLLLVIFTVVMGVIVWLVIRDTQ